MCAKRAVVLEDDRGVRQLLEVVLSTEGWEVVSGESIDEVAGALSWASLVLLDHHLPGMSGLDVLSALRDLGVGVPVVMLTGEPAARERAELLGVDRFLLKPFDLSDLLAVLRRVAEGRSLTTIDLRERVAVASSAAVAVDDRPWFASR
jgi:DNA-binding response OmpR family regulator